MRLDEDVSHAVIGRLHAEAKGPSIPSFTPPSILFISFSHILSATKQSLLLKLYTRSDLTRGRIGYTLSFNGSVHWIHERFCRAIVPQPIAKATGE